jgi:stage V sporulation protein G
MKVTEVRISPARGGKIRAFASIVIDDCFIVNDLRIVEGREGECFVTMPARKARNGQMRDIAHPLNSETRREIEERVLAEYEHAATTLAVPSESDGSARKKEKQSVLDRLASKLFTEDFWTADAAPRQEQKE